MTLGDDIGALRADKNVTVAQLTQEAGISEATYNRILTGHAEPKLPTFLAIMTALRVQMTDFSRQFHDAYMPLYHAWRQVTALVAQPHPSPQALTHLKLALADLERAHHNVGFLQLQARLDLALAAHAHDPKKAASIARDLFGQLSEYAEWSEFEFTLVAPLVEYLPFPQVAAVFTRMAPLAGAADGPQRPALEQPFSQILVTGLQNALATRHRANVEAAVVAIMNRRVRTENLYFQMIQQVARTVIAPALAGDLTSAKTGYADLVGALHFLIQADHNSAYTTLGRLWSGLQDYLAEPEGDS